MNKAVLQFAGFALGALGLLLAPALVAAEAKFTPKLGAYCRVWRSGDYQGGRSEPGA